MRLFGVLLCVILAAHSFAQYPSNLVTNYLDTLKSEKVELTELAGTWMVIGIGYMSQGIELKSNGQAYLHISDCFGKKKEKVEVNFAQNRLSVENRGDIYFRKHAGKLQFFDFNQLHELKVLLALNEIEESTFIERLNHCWLDVQTPNSRS